MWNGCWCTWFHPACAEKGKSPDGNRDYEKRLVGDGKAHAALVFDGDVAAGWCEYGSPDELPDIYHRKEYEAGLNPCPIQPDVLLRGQESPARGVAAVALDGALDPIAQAGGGIVDTRRTCRKKTSASFLYNGTRSLFEKAGFDYERPKGKGHCVMRKVVPSA